MTAIFVDEDRGTLYCTSGYLNTYRTALSHNVCHCLADCKEVLGLMLADAVRSPEHPHLRPLSTGKKGITGAFPSTYSSTARKAQAVQPTKAELS
ncbi:hypothetical protein V2G26_005625 [Clonostachys chloroleuca]